MVADPRSPQPTRFAVQRPRKGAWKTVFVDERLEAAEDTLKALIRANAKGCFRLVRLDHNPEARFEGLEFNWKLIALHAPQAGQYFSGRTLPGQGAAIAATAPGSSRRRERVPIPYGIYVVMAVMGALLAVVLTLMLGEHRPH